MSTPFLHSWQVIKRLVRISVSNVLRRRMAQRTLKLPTRCPKNRLWCGRAMWTHFLHYGHPKGDLDIRLIDVLSKWMPLRTHNMPAGRLKKRDWWIRWSYDSRCRKAMRTLFLHPEHRLGRSRLSNILSRRMGLKTLILPSGPLKKQLCWSPWNEVSE
jgi:hypothetical protein